MTRPATIPWKKSPVCGALLGALLGWVLLQLWRPCFFLTDDNLDGYMPVLVAVMRRFLAGQSPFTEPHLYGGDYYLLRDVATISLWNPLHVLLSPLSLTRFYYWVLDLQVLGCLLVCGGSMAALLLRLRHTEKLALSDRRILFLSLSYTFSVYVLLVGSCWGQFIGNVAALPLIVLGLWQDSWRRGLFLTSLGLGYGLLCGHTHPWIWTLFFGSFFVLGAAWAQRSARPLWVWGGALLLTIVAMSPLLYPAFTGFQGTPRTNILTADLASRARVVPQVLFPGFVLGAFGSVPAVLAQHLWPSALEGSVPPPTLSKIWLHSFAISSCFAGGCLFHCWGARKQLSRLEWLMVGAILFTALFVARPMWLAEVLHHTPLLKSLRWPFREVFFTVFFLHLFIALRPVALSPRAVRLTAGLGVFFWAASLFPGGAPSFANMELDRRLIMSGQADEVWREVRQKAAPGDRFMPVLPEGWDHAELNEVPFSALGGFNYPALWGVTSLTGYSIEGFQKIKPEFRIRHHSGSFNPRGRDYYLQEPGMHAMTYLPGKPLRIEWRGPAGRRVFQLRP